MPFAATAGTQFARIKEATYGVTPVAGNGAFLRSTGESLKFSLSKEQAQELRSDRAISGAVTTYGAASGGLNFHLNYNEYDDLLAGVAMSAWTVYGTNGVQAAASSVTATATTLTAGAATTGNDSWANLRRGQWFRLVAPTSANDGKLFRVSLSVAPSTTVITLDASTPAAVTGAIAGTLVQTSWLTNGTTASSFSIEHQQTDIGQFFLYKGMQPNTMDLDITSKAIINGSIDFLGSTQVRATATGLPGSTAASKTFDIMNAATGVAQLWLGSAPLTSTKVKSVKLKVDNGLREQDAIGTLGLAGIGSGSCTVTGTMEAYFSDGALYDLFRNDTYTSLVISMQDAAGNGYIVTLPRVLFMEHDVQAGAINQEVMATITFQAFNDDTNAIAALRKTIFIDRVGVAAP
jgi:hypothetical protein